MEQNYRRDDRYERLMRVDRYNKKLNLWGLIEWDSAKGYRITNLSADTGDIICEHKFKKIKKL